MNRPQEAQQSSWVADLLATLVSEYGKPNFPCDEWDPAAVEILVGELTPYSKLSDWVN